MTSELQAAAIKALLETAEDLFNRQARGEDVAAELKAWQKRVDRNTTPLEKLVGSILLSYVRARAKIALIRKAIAEFLDRNRKKTK